MQMIKPAGDAPIRLSYSVCLKYLVLAPGCDFIFNVQPAHTARQWVTNEWLTISQGAAMTYYTDPMTRGRFLTLRAAQGPLELRHHAVVDLVHQRAAPAAVGEVWVCNLPGAVLPFLYPSRYCESDLLHKFAVEHFGHLWQGYSRVQAIRDWVLEHVSFVSNSSTGDTTARDTLAQGQGVCRDFAHLMIALCRAVNIPARFATGIDYGADPALGPQDFHAYVEAYLSGGWWLFDPSGTAIPMGLLRLTSGRDAADAAFATIFGSVQAQPPVIGIEALAGADGVLRLPRHSPDALSTDDGHVPV